MSKKLICSILLIAVFAVSAHAQFISGVSHRNTDTDAPEEPEPERPAKWFGIDVVEADDPVARELNVDADEGVVVVGVESGGPAADGGLLRGDVIVKIGDEEIGNLADYRRIMKSIEESDRAIALMVRRGEHTYFVAIKPE